MSSCYIPGSWSRAGFFKFYCTLNDSPEDLSKNVDSDSANPAWVLIIGISNRLSGGTDATDLWTALLFVLFFVFLFI